MLWRMIETNINASCFKSKGMKLLIDPLVLKGYVATYWTCQIHKSTVIRISSMYSQVMNPGWWTLINMVECITGLQGSTMLFQWNHRSVTAYQINVKVKFLFWAHIQAQILMSTFTAHWNLWNLSSQVPICSWVERNNKAYSPLFRDTTTWNTNRTSNPGRDLDPDK